MCEEVGNRVMALERVRIGTLPLGRLQIGSYKKISKVEIEKYFPQAKR